MFPFSEKKNFEDEWGERAPLLDYSRKKDMQFDFWVTVAHLSLLFLLTPWDIGNKKRILIVGSWLFENFNEWLNLHQFPY